MKKTQGHDYSTMLIWAAGLVGMIRYAAAFLASDVGQIVGITSQIITLMLGLSGFAMGILGTFGTIYLFDGWRKKMPASGHKWPFKFVVLTIFVMAAFLVELVILVPFTVSRMEHTTMSAVLGGGVWWWSTAVNVMPMLLLGGVSVGNQVVSVSSTNLPETYQKLSEDEQKLTGNFPSDWRKVRKLLTEEQLREMARMNSGTIAYTYGVSERTATNWRANARKELEKVQP